MRVPGSKGVGDAPPLEKAVTAGQGQLTPAELVRMFAAAVIRWRLTALDADTILGMGPGDAARVASANLRPSRRALSRLAVVAFLYVRAGRCPRYEEMYVRALTALDLLEHRPASETALEKFPIIAARWLGS